jgi:uncharacterized coiled-coil protein SlyX
VSDPLFDQTDHFVLQKRNGTASRVLGFIAVLAVVGAAAGYVFLNYDRPVGAAPATQSTAAPAAGPDAIPLQDVMSLQEQMAESLEATRRDVATQRADLKNLSDRVAALAAKIDGLQSSARPAAPSEPLRPAAIAAQKKPPTAPKPPKSPKPTGAISVGGAPLLPSSPQEDQK